MKKLYTFMLKEKFLLLFTTVIVCLFFVVKHMYDNRFDGYLYTEALNYNELYMPEDAHKINALNLKGDSLQLFISPVPGKTNWTINDSKGNSYTLSAALPLIKLQQGQNSYTLTSQSGDQKINRITSEIEFDQPSASAAILKMSLPLIEYSLFPVNKWTGLSASISEKEISETKKILRDEIKISDSLSTFEKIKLIGSFLVKNLRESEGAPQGNMKTLSPLTQYRVACKKQNKVDCADYTDIFHLFANCAGIPTRKIGLMAAMNGVGTSGHVFNECYIPELERWAFVDLTSKKLLVVNSQFQPLNAADLLNTVNTESFEGKKAIVLNESNNIDTVDYATVNQSEIIYFKPTVQLYVIRNDINNNMDFKQTFTEFLGTTSHYGTYYVNTLKVDNSKHFLKLFVFNASVVLFLLWLAYIIFRIVFFFTAPLLKANSGNNRIT